MLSRDEFIYTAQVTARPEDSRYRLAQLTGDRTLLLDAGCAVGYIGEFLRLLPPQRWLAGIELDPGAAEEARPHYDQLIIGSIEDEEVWDQLVRKPEAIIFGDVLEHTTDPLRVLRIASRHLTDDGVVIVSIPNVAHVRIRLRLLFGRFEYEEWGIMDRTHLRFFTFASAQKLLSDAGFRILGTEAIHTYVPPADLSPIRRLGVGLRGRLRSGLARRWPTLFAKQLILVGTR